MSLPPPRAPAALPRLLLVLAVFAAGALAERAGWLPGSRRPVAPPDAKAFAPFWEARETIKAHYVDRSRVDDEQLSRGAISGMVASLGDPGHTAYLDPRQRREMTEQLAGELEGIGATIEVVKQRPTIVHTFPRSPARAAGLRAGDVLLAVDGEPVAKLSLVQIVDRVRGKPGTKVQLRVARARREKPLDLSVRRARIEVPEVGWQVLPGPGPRVAQLVFQGFSSSSARQMHAALAALAHKGVEGLVLDLRGNAGGLKDQAVAIAGEFLPPGSVVLIQQDAAGNREEVRVPDHAEGAWRGRPMVVLVDGGTGSSAEILAGALQDHGRAKVVGTRTFGTGTVLREFGLSDGSALLLAVGLWLTPRGRQIWHHGITPDPGLRVRLPEGANPLFPDETPLTAEAFALSDDEPLRKAYTVLREQVRQAGK